MAPQPATQGEVPPDSENPELKDRLTEMLDWGPQERFTKFAEAFRFRVKVFTALESRRERLEQLSQFTEMSEAMPGMAARVKWHNVAEEAARALELDPERYLWPNSGQTVEAMQQPSKDILAPRPVQLVPPQAPNAPPSNSY